ncbi:hypothetical protein [Fimbriimonas ginsengisoli]|uniref:Uncharacterized protein n=1 Tax=Fimbriimonas ginsengisoli Gsoil 348 TaxID=661478 RepID=A0A068NR22_FIMGI|nr:hypothetical protein [Fimbriimonas ginsengisoli]AIE85988.1 hypothetical protein OP10G_2620 [Fimbriimonas ginsengisoli Gsoil 348]
MNDVDIKPATGWNILFGVSLLAIALSIWFGYMRPPEPGAELAWKRSLTKMTLASRKANDEADANFAPVKEKMWSQTIDTLGSTVLDQLTRMSEEEKLQLSGFHTEKAIDVAGLKEAPFVLTVEGTFPQVIAFMKKLEGPQSKLAVNLLQISASDTAPGNVTATLGLVGFVKGDA